MKRYGQEISVAIATAVLAAVLAFAAPSYFSRENLSDLFLSNMPVLLVAIGMTLVILTGEIDVSVGSIFAICGVMAGVISKTGVPTSVACLAACAIGAGLGALNGALVAYVRIPSIVVTLATMTALRDGLRWATQGAWIADLPARFQWFGFTQATYPIAALLTAVVLVVLAGWGLRHLAAGRAIYATGSNAEAARVAGINTHRLVFLVFVFTGAVTGLAAVFNSVRFNQIPSNAGLGLELKVIAAVVVGGTAITGGRGTILGTVLGVVLLGAIGPALTFLGTSAYWEQALQGVVILAAITIEAIRSRAEKREASLAAQRV
jgi:rhamnose transport system permease protein